MSEQPPSPVFLSQNKVRQNHATFNLTMGEESMLSVAQHQLKEPCSTSRWEPSYKVGILCRSPRNVHISQALEERMWEGASCNHEEVRVIISSLAKYERIFKPRINTTKLKINVNLRRLSQPSSKTATVFPARAIRLAATPAP